MGIRFFTAILLSVIVHCACSAQSESDLDLIFSQGKVENSTVAKSEHKRFRPVPLIFKPGYLLFKGVFYKQMGLVCQFEKPCIDFCPDLIQQYGAIKGYFVSFDRIVRCNRLAPLETYPSGLTREGKIIDEVSDYHNR